MSIVAVVVGGEEGGGEEGELGLEDPPPHAAARHRADVTPRAVTRMLSPFELWRAP